MKVWGQKHLFWNKKVVKNGTGKMKIKQTTSKKVQAFVSQLLSFVFLGVSVSSAVVLINSHETVTNNKSIALTSLKCTGKLFMGKRKKESDTTISCNLNGLKASFGFWAVTEKEGVETLLIWFFWLSKTNFRLVGAQTSVINKEVCPWEMLWSQFY